MCRGRRSAASKPDVPPKTFVTDNECYTIRSDLSIDLAETLSQTQKSNRDIEETCLSWISLSQPIVEASQANEHLHNPG